MNVSIHHRNLQVLATEIFKIHPGLSLELLRETFLFKTSSYNLRRNDTFERRKVHSHATESLLFRPKKIGICTSGFETIKKTLRIKNKEMGTL